VEVLYTSNSCTSCRKAKNILKQNNISFEEKNINNTHLTKEEIRRILSFTTNGTEDILSKRSNVVKELDLDIDLMTIQELIKLIIERPGLLRRPLLLSNDKLIIGYNSDEYNSLIKRRYIN
jgi:regulatory protein spx